MQERTRLEAELAALGLRSARAAAPAQREFEADVAREYLAPVSRMVDRLERFRIKGGLYTPAEKTYAASHSRGLLLTAPVVGKQERSLAGRAPATLTVSKELARFEGGKLGAYVQNYNDFSNLLEEVLRHIGRLRDLLSAGAPEAPTDLTATQKATLRPTGNSQATAAKKRAYRDWRTAQKEYAMADSKGNLSGGRMHEMLKASRAFDLARQEFWQAQGEFRRTLAEAKRSGKPVFDLDIKLNDVVEIVQGGLGLLHVVDYVLEARSKRKEYDAKMKAFADILRATQGALRDQFEAMTNAGEVYWERLADYRGNIDARNAARADARERAMLLGQELAPRGEKRNRVLAAIRMPALVSDAWRALAITGPVALRKLQAVLAAEDMLKETNFHYAKRDPFGLEDITQARKSFAQAASWTGVLTKDDVEEWAAMNKLWDETFTKFNV